MATKKPKITPRKPPTQDTAAFVTGGAHGAGGDKTTVYKRKGDSEELARVTIYLPKELFKRAKVRAVESEMPLSAYVTKVLEASL